MADAIPFLVYDDATGAPLVGGVGGFVVSAWDAWLGTTRAAPTVFEVAGGYELHPSDADETAGTVTLVDAGPGHSPRYQVFTAFKRDNSNQFIALLFTDNAGALWTTNGHTLSWSGTTAPSVVQISAGVFVVLPTAADIAVDASGFVVAEVGALPERYAVGCVPYGEAPAPPPPPEPPPGLPLPSPSLTSSLGDIRLQLDEWLRGDALLVGNDLDTDEGLETAMFISLFLDRYDDTSEDPTQRRGWWADGLETAEDRIGSRLWLAEVAGKLTADLPDKLRTWTREALQWLLDDGVARSLDITPALTRQGYELAVDVYRPAKNDPSRFRFSRVWAAQEAR